MRCAAHGNEGQRNLGGHSTRSDNRSDTLSEILMSGLDLISETSLLEGVGRLKDRRSKNEEPPSYKK